MSELPARETAGARLAPTITGWRDVRTALRCPGWRLPTVLALVAVVEAYFLCFIVAELVAAVTLVLVSAVLDWPPDLTVAQFASGAVVGTPVYFVNVKLMYRLANRVLRPAAVKTERSGL